MKIHHLPDLDGFMQEYVDISIEEDPFGGWVRTVFAWGHPVLVVTRDNARDEYRASWVILDQGPDLEMLTRHREVLANFLIEQSMIGQPDDYEPTYEVFADQLGKTGETLAFSNLTEHLGEHELPAFIERVLHATTQEDET